METLKLAEKAVLTTCGWRLARSTPLNRLPMEIFTTLPTPALGVLAMQGAFNDVLPLGPQSKAAMADYDLLRSRIREFF